MSFQLTFLLAECRIKNHDNYVGHDTGKTMSDCPGPQECKNHCSNWEGGFASYFTLDLHDVCRCKTSMSGRKFEAGFVSGVASGCGGKYVSKINPHYGEQQTDTIYTF